MLSPERTVTTAAAILLLASFNVADVSATPADDLPGAGPAPADGATAGARSPLRILTIMTVDTMSHHLWMSPLTMALAKRGHHVESVDILMPKEVPPTMNVTVIETAFRSELDGMDSFISAGPLGQINMLVKFSLAECQGDLAAPALRRFTDPSYTGEFDLIIIDYLADCVLGFAHRFGYPGLVLLSPFPGYSELHNLKGNPSLPALVPHTVLPFPHPMTLWQRAATLGVNGYLRALDWWNRPVIDGILRREFGKDVPSVEELRRAVHVAFVNENPVLDMPRPYVPGVIPVGGMHVLPANLSNIPADLRSWLDSAKKGFIFVSFGSIMPASSIDKVKMRALLDSFRALGDVRVLWKIEPNAGLGLSMSGNTRTGKWLPQNDILGHPNIVLFVSHCGGLSTHESAYHGVPMLGMPIIIDQFINLEKVFRIGMARKLPFAELTKDRLVAELQAMLLDSSYRTAARRASMLLRDQPASPLDTAVWWCEYVGRHRGAPHLRSPVLDVPWHQVMLLDVVALLMVAVIVMVFALFLVARACARCAQKHPSGAGGRKPKRD